MYIMGLDIGYSNMKIAAGLHDGSTFEVRVFPVGAGPRHLMPASIKGQTAAVQVLVDDQEFVACIEPERLANWERALHDDYPASVSYRALFHAALLTSGRSVIDKLVTGLPVSHWLDEKRRAAVAKRLMGFHAIGRDRAVRIVDVSVIPQPVGAYLDTAVASGREQEFADAEVLILDPGFFSVDWVLMSGTDIQYEFSSSSTLATSRLLEEVEKLIYQEFECRVPVNKLERAIREGRKDVPIFSDRVELAPLLGRAAERVSDMVMNNVRASMRSKGADITKVVLAGGGAEYYRPAVAAIFPRAEIILPKNPVLANARGFWHYAQL